MIRPRVVAVAMLAIALSSCGRSDGPPLYPVRGKVMYNGQPAVGAIVVFQREDAPAALADGTPILPTAEVDSDGNFTLATPELGTGAPAGKFKVLIHWRTREEGKPALAPEPKKKSRFTLPRDKPDGAPDRLEGRYMNAANARIHVEIKPEANDLSPFDVSS